MKSLIVSIAGLVVMFIGTTTVSAEETVSQTLTLVSGWNIISTPMVLDSHSFSADETSENFDIYLLDPSQSTGWATMADMGQTEFEPLYGYFVNNKTGINQTLTFNFDTTLTPNEKLFERAFSTTGWYSIGVANAEYAKTQSADRVDTDNPASVLSLLSGDYDLVIDFTDDVYSADRKSVAVGDPWKAVVPGDINELNDLRDTKGYAVYVTNAGAKYNGFQNDAVAEVSVQETLTFSLSSNNPDATDIIVDEDDSTDGVTILEYTIEADGGDVELAQLWVNIETGIENVGNIVDDIYLVVNGEEFNVETVATDSTSVNYQFNVNEGIFEGESATVEVFVDFKAQDGNYAHYGETIQAQVTEELVGDTIASGIDEQLDVEQLMGVAIGETHSLLSGGIVIPADGVQTTADSVGDNDQMGEFLIEFEVTAIEDDFYITDNVATSTGVTDGVSYSVELGSGTANYTSALTSSADEDTNGVFIVREGETESFTLIVTVDTSVSTQARVTLTQVYYSAFNNGLNGEAYVPTPASDFRTAYQAINAN